MSIVLDYNYHALCKMADNAYEDGNAFEWECLNTLIEGYEDGLWEVEWRDGQPIFKAILTQEEKEKLAQRMEQTQYV